MNSSASTHEQPTSGTPDPAATQDQASRPVRRRHARKAVSIRALLHCNGRFQTTTIEDLSKGGARLNGADGISVGDEVLIELLDRRQLRGKVRWWLANNCGLSFLEDLPDTDPLLTG